MGKTRHLRRRHTGPGEHFAIVSLSGSRLQPAHSFGGRCACIIPRIAAKACPLSRMMNMPSFATEYDKIVMGVIEKWKITAAEDVNDIGGWRDSVSERERFKDDPRLY
jgi:hypothetical protein